MIGKLKSPSLSICTYANLTPKKRLKIIADHYNNFKLIVSGSSTLEIKQKFKDSLAGRKVVFEIYPLDFYEVLSKLNHRGHRENIKYQ